MESKEGRPLGAPPIRLAGGDRCDTSCVCVYKMLQFQGVGGCSCERIHRFFVIDIRRVGPSSVKNGSLYSPCILGKTGGCRGNAMHVYKAVVSSGGDEPWTLAEIHQCLSCPGVRKVR